jgi:hypothetical protein
MVPEEVPPAKPIVLRAKKEAARAASLSSFLPTSGRTGAGGASSGSPAIANTFGRTVGSLTLAYTHLCNDGERTARGFATTAHQALFMIGERPDSCLPDFKRIAIHRTVLLFVMDHSMVQYLLV